MYLVSDRMSLFLCRQEQKVRIEYLTKILLVVLLQGLVMTSSSPGQTFWFWPSRWIVSINYNTHELQWPLPWRRSWSSFGQFSSPCSVMCLGEVRSGSCGFHDPCLTRCVWVELWRGGTAVCETPQPPVASPSRGLVENSRWTPPSSSPPPPPLPPLPPPPSPPHCWWRWRSSWGCSSKLRVELKAMRPLREEGQQVYVILSIQLMMSSEERDDVTLETLWCHPERQVVLYNTVVRFMYLYIIHYVNNI